MFKFKKGNPENLKGKFSIFFREISRDKLFAIIGSTEDSDLSKFLSKYTYFEPSQEPITEDEKIKGYIVYSKIPIQMKDEQELEEFEDIERIYLGELFLEDASNISEILKSAFMVYYSHYYSQIRGNNSKIQKFIRDIKYTGNFYTDFEPDKLKKNMRSKLSHILDSIQFNRGRDLEKGLFDLKMFLREFPNQEIVTKMIKVAKSSSVKKLDFLDLLINEIAAIRGENYEEAGEIKKKIKKLERKISKDI